MQNGIGELIVSGRNVFMGYHNDRTRTVDAFNEHHWFKTGDLGKFDSDGFLYITGRIKEQYKLENGKYVVPSPLEEKITLSPYILQAMLFGANKLYNVVVLVPEREALEKYASSNGIDASGDDLLTHPKIRELIQKELEQHTATFKGYERPKNFALVNEEWSPENGLLTPTLKLKRRIVVDHYASLIESLYK